MSAGSAQASNATTDLLWFNPTTGELSSWQLNGHGNVLGTQALYWRCGEASGCFEQWRPDRGVPAGTRSRAPEGA